eukprot:TRINITY_DN1434_c0_g3_i1.p1 TRINITY_DN1434_c0_g3~~TRINITY_DN1434_c0_g3_i1.p1  ORF type:complete len:654 (-),score=157.00 TRINITY_DN1434_c0_g3_i1:216-2177(-)
MCTSDSKEVGVGAPGTLFFSFAAGFEDSIQQPADGMQQQQQDDVTAQIAAMLPRRRTVVSTMQQLAEPQVASVHHLVDVYTRGRSGLLVAIISIDTLVAQLINEVIALTSAGCDLSPAREAGVRVSLIVERVIKALGGDFLERRHYAGIMLAYTAIFLRLLMQDEEGALEMLLFVQRTLCCAPGLLYVVGVRHNLCRMAALLLSAGLHTEYDEFVRTYNAAGIGGGRDVLPVDECGKSQLCLCRQHKCAAIHRVVVANQASGIARIFTRHTLNTLGVGAAMRSAVRAHQPPSLFVSGPLAPVAIATDIANTGEDAQAAAATAAPLLATQPVMPMPPDALTAPTGEAAGVGGVCRTASCGSESSGVVGDFTWIPTALMVAAAAEPAAAAAPAATAAPPGSAMSVADAAMQSPSSPSAPPQAPHAVLIGAPSKLRAEHSNEVSALSAATAVAPGSAVVAGAAAAQSSSAAPPSPHTVLLPHAAPTDAPSRLPAEPGNANSVFPNHAHAQPMRIAPAAPHPLNAGSSSGNGTFSDDEAMEIIEYLTSMVAQLDGDDGLDMALPSFNDEHEPSQDASLNASQPSPLPLPLPGQCMAAAQEGSEELFEQPPADWHPHAAFDSGLASSLVCDNDAFCATLEAQAAASAAVPLESSERPL